MHSGNSNGRRGEGTSGAEHTTALMMLPDLSADDERVQLTQLVLDSVTSPHSKRAYRTT
jgi:hypothetical protein